MNERYAEYLKSSEWKIIRDKKLNTAKYVCDGCGEKSGAMQVHHLNYDRIGCELLTDLASYCIVCHKKAHGLYPKSEWSKYIRGESNIKPKHTSVEDIKMMELINSI
jgi:hypothetical protein